MPGATPDFRGADGRQGGRLLKFQGDGKSPDLGTRVPRVRGARRISGDRGDRDFWGDTPPTAGSLARSRGDFGETPQERQECSWGGRGERPLTGGVVTPARVSKEEGGSPAAGPVTRTGPWSSNHPPGQARPA